MRILNMFSLMIVALTTGGLFAEYSSKMVAWDEGKAPMPALMKSATYSIRTGIAAKGFAYKCVTISNADKDTVKAFLAKRKSSAEINDKMIENAPHGVVKKVLHDFNGSSIEMVKDKLSASVRPQPLAF